ncbi:MAG: hypothetical protein EPN19_04070 [Betaproteobacteria bacterium]|nr:MAG: hypothetical protein EPN19_04070 [Betaproteobacteria bacterium]
MNRSAIFALTTMAFALAPAAWANTINRITPEADRVALSDGRATVNFMVSGQGSEGDCGIWIDYGDQGSPDTRIVGRRDGMLPREFVHTFSRAGQFTVTAKGRRVKTTMGCDGEASTVVTVIDAGERRRRGPAAEASCPAGWGLREGSFDRKTGAFTCVPAYPEQRIDCGPNLRYFERDGTLGCRARGERRR